MNNVNNGQDVNLTNCDKEPIHQLSKIQQYGGLIGLSEDWSIIYCSDNIDQFCPYTTEQCLTLDADALFQPHTIALIKETIANSAVGQSERLFGEYLFAKDDLYDVSVHFSQNIIVIEFEYHHALTHQKSLQSFRNSLRALSQTETIDRFFMHATDTVSELTGFDRVMLYRFHNDGTGEVIAESKEPHMDSFLGLRYPASDIPKQARRLYVKNLTRQIEDVHSQTVDIVCRFDDPRNILDLSMSTLRAVSPIHIEYLKNMGVGSSFSLSIVVDGELWGLFACHHNSRHYLSLELRSIIEVYGEVFSLELASRLRNLSLVNTEKAQNLQVKIMSSMNNEETVYNNLAPHLKSFHNLIPCESAFLWVDKKLATVGHDLNDEDAMLIVNRLNQMLPTDIICTDNISTFLSNELTVTERFTGMMAIPISRRPRDFLVFLRKEETQSIKWAGNPEKPVDYGPNGARLTPRKSFAAWQELRKGYSAPWLQKEIGLGKLFKQMLLEIVIRNIDERERLIRDSQQQQDMLIHELNHRVRNILGLISSVISKTATNASNVVDFKKVLGGRIDAIAVAQNQLTQRNWTHAPLLKLIETELSAYSSDKQDKITLSGPDINIAPKAYTTLTLVIHELVTNAVKHGALQHDEGKLSISWDINQHHEVAITWNEEGYPNKSEFKKGFGSIIINRSIPFDLGGQAHVKVHPNGLEVNLLIPANYVFLPTASPLDDLTNSDNSLPISVSNEHPLSALILEDNMIIALDVEETLTNSKVQHVYVASNSLEAEGILTSKHIDFAILDVNLGGENSYDIGKLCQAKDIPFVFVTGYNELEGIKDNGFENVKLLLKPFNADEILQFVDELDNL